MVKQTYIFLLLCALLCISSVKAADIEGPSGGPLQLDDLLEPLTPKVPRSEADEDRLQALSLFSAGRMLEQEGDFPGALRLYQRALRYDEDSLSILRQIVPLTFSLDRSDEALRYAAMLAEQDVTDPTLLRRVAGVLAEQGDYEKALRLYQKLLEKMPADKIPAEKRNAAQVMLRMEIGRLFFLSKKYEKAADSFAYVLKALTKPDEYGLEASQQKMLTSENGVAFELFGEAFLEANRLDDALAAYEQLAKVNPNPGVHAYYRARIAAARGETADALKLLEEYFAAKEQSKNTDPYQLLGKLYDSQGKAGELIAHLEKLRTADPENTWLQYYLAAQQLNAMDYAKAAALFEPLLETKPTIEAYQGLLQCYRKMSRPDAVLTLLRQAIGRANSFEPFGVQLDELVEESGLVESIIELARKTDAQQAETSEIARAAALLAVESGRFELVEEFYSRAEKSTKEELAQLTLIWGVELLRADKPGEAAKVFQRGVDQKLLPQENPAFYFYLAGALELDGQTDAALAAAKKAAEAQPRSAQFASRVGWILYHAGRNDEAIAAYRELFEKFGDDYTSGEVRESLRDARSVLSNIYVNKGELAQAEEWLEQILDEFPGDIGASNDLGYLWADSGKHLRRAHAMIERAVKSDPENKAYRDSLGWILFRLGRYAEAKQQLELATAGEAPDGVILEHLAETYAKLGESPRALETFERAKAAIETSKEPEAKKLEAITKRIEELRRSAEAAVQR